MRVCCRRRALRAAPLTLALARIVSGQLARRARQISRREIIQSAARHMHASSSTCPADLFSSCLRGCLGAGEPKVAHLKWMRRQRSSLHAHREGRPDSITVRASRPAHFCLSIDLAFQRSDGRRSGRARHLPERHPRQRSVCIVNICHCCPLARPPEPS